MTRGKLEIEEALSEVSITKSSMMQTLTLCSGITMRQGSIEDAGINRFGLHTEASRNISPLAIIAVGWNICNSWAAVAATMALSIANGGPVTLIYGLLLIFILAGSSAATMAELANVYPTAGGQYHWTSILAPRRWSASLVGFRIRIQD
jgi:choline transport protein